MYSCTQSEVDQTIVESWRDVLKGCEVRVPLNQMEGEAQMIDQFIEKYADEEIIAVNLFEDSDEGVFTRYRVHRLENDEGDRIGFIDVEADKTRKSKIYATFGKRDNVVFYSAFCFFDLMKNNPALNKVLIEQEFIPLPDDFEPEGGWDQSEE